MDISDSLSTNSVELDETMGSILSTSNENEAQSTETDPSENIATDESNLISQNIEVNELQNAIKSDNLPDTADDDVVDNVTSYTETLTDQDINIIIMGKASGSIDDPDEIISSSNKNTPNTSQIDEHEELWLGDNTRQLVKVDTDEDFDVIVKSLETAIVETDRCDIDTEITTSEEAVISSSENSLGLSMIETGGHSLLEDIPSDLLTSTVPPLHLQEESEEEPVEISLEIPDSPVGIIQHRNIDTYEEFAAISEPTVESLDEQSNSLFEVLEPDIDLPVDNEPCLLELQEATMPTDIPEDFVCKEIEEEILTTVENEFEICEVSVDSETAEKPSDEAEIVTNVSDTEESSSIVAKSSQIVTESPSPVPESSEITKESSEIVAESSSPVADLLAQIVESSTPIADSPTPIEELSEIIADSPETVVELPATVIEVSDIIAESSSPVADSPAQILEPSEIAESVTSFAELSEIIAESPEPNDDSFTPIAELSDIIAESSPPVAESPAVIVAELSAPVEGSPESNADSFTPIVESSDIIAESSASVAESPATVIVADLSAPAEESPESNADSFTPIAELQSPVVPKLIVESPITVTESPTTGIESSSVVAELCASVAESQAPIAESSTPGLPELIAESGIVAELSVPVAESPTPITESSAPIAESSTPVTELSELIKESSTPIADSPELFSELPKIIAKITASIAESATRDTKIPIPIVVSPRPIAESPEPIAESPEPISESPTPVVELPELIAKSPALITESLSPVAELPSPESPTPFEEFSILIEELPSPVAELPALVAESPTAVEELSTPDAELPTPVTKLPAPVEESLMEIHETKAPVEGKKEITVAVTSISSIENLDEIQISQNKIINEQEQSTLVSENMLDKIDDNLNDNLVTEIESTSEIDEDYLNKSKLKLGVNITEDKDFKSSKDSKDCKNEVEKIEETNLKNDIIQDKNDQHKNEEIEETTIKENIREQLVDMKKQLDDKITKDRTDESKLKGFTQELQPDEVSSPEIFSKQESIESTESEITLITTEDIQEVEENITKNNESVKVIKSSPDTELLSKTSVMKISDTDKTTKISESQNMLLKEKEVEQLPLKIEASTSKSVKHSLESDEKEQSPPKKIKLVRQKFQPKPGKSETKYKDLSKNIETVFEPEMKINPEKIDSVEKEKNLVLQEEIINIPIEKSVVEHKETIEEILEKLEDSSDKNESKSPVRAQKLKLQRNYKLPPKSVKQAEKNITVPTKKIVAETKSSNRVEIKSNTPTIQTIEEKISVEKIITHDINSSDNAPEKTTKKIIITDIEINKSIVESSIPTTEQKSDNKFKYEIKSAEPIKEIEIKPSGQEITTAEIISNKNIEQEIIESVEDIQMNKSSFIDKSDDKELEDKQEVTDVNILKDVKDATKHYKLSLETSNNIEPESVDQTEEEIEIEEQTKIIEEIIDTENNELEENKYEIAEKMEQDEHKTEIKSLKNIKAVQEIKEDVIENIIDTQVEHKTSDMNILLSSENVAIVDEKIEVLEKTLRSDESCDEVEEPEMLTPEEEQINEEVDMQNESITQSEIKSTKVECTNTDSEKQQEKTEIGRIVDIQKIPEKVSENEMLIEENIDEKNIVYTEEETEKGKIEISSKMVESSEIESRIKEVETYEIENITEKLKIIQETEGKTELISEIEKEPETDYVISTESVEHTQVSIATQKLIEIMQKEDIEEIEDAIEETKYEEETKDEVDKAEPTKTESLLTINTDYPLLSSRLQERFEPKRRKLTDEVKITAVSFPKISQECVSKKLREQLTTTKDVLPTKATALLVENPEITLTKEIRSSVSDHSATMESATKIKITKRKLATPEPTVRSVTKPLSVQIDDVESSTEQRSHSYGGSGQKEHENIPKLVIKSLHRSEGRSSPKITIKPIKPPEEIKSREESSHSPKITIKPIVKPDPLKITITKQKTDDTHSILKIYQPEDSQSEQHVPKLTIKSIPKNDDMQHSPRITIKPVKPSPTSSMSPKITVKPIPSPKEQVEMINSQKHTKSEESYPKVTIKPVLRPEESHKASQLSPRQIKLKSMTFESSSGVTVEPITTQKLDPEIQTSQLKISVKSFAKMEETLSPKLTIKPITKTCEIVQSEDGTSNPLKLTIKPILKPEETSYQSPKITIKPIVKPDEQEELDKPERIILKIQKNNLPSPKERKESKKEPEIKIEAIPHDPEKCQKLDKIKLKLTKEGSHAQIIPSISTITTDGSFSLKRSFGISDSGVVEKRSKTEFSGTEILHTSDISINIVEPNAKPCPKSISEEVTIMKIDKASGSREQVSEQQISQSKFKEMLMKIQQKPDITCTPHIEADDYSSSSDDVKIVEVLENDPLKDPLSLQDDSNSQDVVIVNEVINTNPFQNIQIINAHTIEPNTPKKRGRPRKNPLEVKPEIKGEDCIEVRPKRTCRAPPGRTPFVVKERKPRGAGRARGSSRGRGASKSPQKSPKELKTTPRGKALKEAKALAKLEAARLAQEVVIDEITIEDSTNDTPAATPIPPAEDSPKKPEVKCASPSPLPQMIDPEVKIINDDVKTINEEVKIISEEVKIINEEIKNINEEALKQPPPPAVYEEETRMSADNSSRAQTPARQEVFTAPLPEGPEESQSSVQSTATTESSKTKKGRLEVIDPDSAVTTVEQIVEYSWANGGPYMLQEQIAQFLGVKSFKRKYPGLTRRPVEMQERDYIREKGLVHESMCDMGLTAVPSSEILDIMYSDFQEKYEEYRKCLRDKQAKEISNKQKAVSLATSQEKNKIDFKERAIRSAASWNLNFNKARKDGRKCCMDLQTFTINYPAGKIKVLQKTPVGHYPLALVPGQYTDYFKSYTPNELNYLPLNTVRYGPVLPNQHCDPGQSDGSQSDSDSSSGSDSDSSDDSMSTEEEATSQIICRPVEVNLTQLITTPKSKVH